MIQNIMYLWRSIYSWIILFSALISYIIMKNGGSKETFLLIGILSSPDHFEQREVLRRTWLQNIGQDVIYYFLLGKDICDIPIYDRVDEQSCTELPLFIPEIPDNQIFQSGNFTCFDDHIDVLKYFGYSFTVQYDIVIKRFGVINNFLVQPVKINLVEANSGFKIISATFLPNGSSDIQWQNVDNYKLPKGFEGRISMEQIPTSKFTGKKCGFDWKSAGNILAYHMFWFANGLPTQFNNISITPIVIGFDIPDFTHLQNFLNEKQERTRKWKNEISDIRAKVLNEFSNSNDMLLLDVMDVYRSLSKKMLEFYKWAPDSVKFSFLLKTDDDTYLNIKIVKEELYSLSQHNKGLLDQIWWWSEFREGWMVQWSGKWRETSYHSFTYPPFPCGAGYVLSRGAVIFLQSIADKLFTKYQGEDVALGIWLSGTKPNTVINRTSCSWICDKITSDSQKCNHPQLSPNEIENMYQSENYSLH